MKYRSFAHADALEYGSQASRALAIAFQLRPTVGSSVEVLLGAADVAECPGHPLLGGIGSQAEPRGSCTEGQVLPVLSGGLSCTVPLGASLKLDSSWAARWTPFAPFDLERSCRKTAVTQLDFLDCNESGRVESLHSPS